MYYVYILYSKKARRFYTGYTEDLKKRFADHNNGIVISTKPYVPWKIIQYQVFTNKKIAKDFEKYLKTGSGKAFMYKRLVDSGTLKKEL